MLNLPPKLLGLRLSVPVAVDNALVNPCGKGHGKRTVLGADDYGDRLAGVAADERRLRVAFHLL